MISLAGEWRFQMGCEDADPSELTFPSTIQIPGILQAQGYGEEITRQTPWISSLHDPLWYIRGEYQRGQEEGVNVPFLAQPPRHYLGVAWYQRTIEVEEGTYEFEVECCRWKTQVWMDDRMVGTVVSVCAPHQFSLGYLQAGKHVLTVKIDNRMQYPYRPDGHGVSDALAATWNGMVGKVSLKKEMDLSVRELVLKSHSLEQGQTRLDVSILFCNRTDKAEKVQLTLCVTDSDSGRQKQIVQQTEVPVGEDRQDFCVDCQEISGMWDEYQPDVQKLTVTLQTKQGQQQLERSFGFRALEVKEGKFLVNGRPTYLRGTHFGGDFPLTGYPSTTESDWERIFTICREWGLNFMRFHSYCPPEAAFLAADRMGMYLQVECPMWNIFNEENGMAAILWGETERILKNFGHHPSFLMLSPSNEPAGKWEPVLAEWYHRCKAEERHYSGQRLYTMQSGWPYPVMPSEITDTDYVYFHRSGYGPFSGGTIRNTPGWGEKDYRSSIEGIRYPVITHELGQWCSYPDFSVMDKFTGYMCPGNYHVFRENAKAAHVLEQNKELTEASGKLQVQMYKEELEANFRTPHIYGYELLDLHDYLGQGTALVGVLDAFWDEKGYVTAKEFRHFCDETVLLLRIAKRVYVQEEEINCAAELSHFGREKLCGAEVCWNIRNKNGRTIKKGTFGKRDYELAKNQELGSITLRLTKEDFAAPACYTIELSIADTDIRNSWKIWVYEKETEVPVLRHAIYTRDLETAVTALKEGKKVVYCPHLSVLDWKNPYLAQRPSFWNAQMGPRWSRGMGILCAASHPALSQFPTESYQEYQWTRILKDAKGINLCDYPSEFRPIVQPIDEWNRSYKMSLVLEAKVGEGSLLFVSSDLETKQEECPEKRQLLKSLLSYADSEEFCPKQEVRMEDFLKSFADTQVMKRLQVSARLLEEPSADLSAVLDGNPDTVFQMQGAGYPYTIEMSWQQKETLAGLIYMPVQNQRNHDGEIREYEVWYRKEENWCKIAEGEWESSFEPKRMFFEEQIETTGLRFVAKSGFRADWAWRYMYDENGWYAQEGAFEDRGISIAELALVTAQGAMAAGEEKETEIVRTEGKTATAEIDD